MTWNFSRKASWPPSLKVSFTSSTGSWVGTPPPATGFTRPDQLQAPNQLETTRVSSKLRMGAEKDLKSSSGLAGRYMT